MNFEQFIEKTKEALGDYFGEEAEIKTHQVYKNNGVLLQGVCALEKGKNIAPTVYLNDFYDKYDVSLFLGNITKAEFISCFL